MSLQAVSTANRPRIRLQYTHQFGQHPDNIKWLSGQAKITNYHHPSSEFSKYFCTAKYFCTVCGSPVEFINKTKT